MTDSDAPKKDRPKKVPGMAEAIQYDPAHLLRVWSSLPPPPTVDALHKALVAGGLQCSKSWVKKKVAEHHIVALARSGTVKEDESMVTIRAVRKLLEDIGKDMNPHAMLSGLQTRTVVLISDHLTEKAGKKADPEWLQAMMKFYKQLTDELMHTYQKRLEAGEKLPLPERKADADEVVTPFTKRKA